MQPDASLLFRSRGEFVEAVLTGLSATRRELVLLDRDFSDWPLDTRVACGTIAAFLAADTGARVRLLVADPSWLERRSNRFMPLRRRHAAAIECRRMPESLFSGEGLLIGDRRHLVRRSHGDFFRGRLSLNDPSTTEAVASRCDALWEESTPCLPPSTLGL